MIFFFLCLDAYLSETCIPKILRKSCRLQINFPTTNVPTVFPTTMNPTIFSERHPKSRKCQNFLSERNSLRIVRFSCMRGLYDLSSQLDRRTRWPKLSKRPLCSSCLCSFAMMHSVEMLVSEKMSMAWGCVVWEVFSHGMVISGGCVDTDWCTQSHWLGQQCVHKSFMAHKKNVGISLCCLIEQLGLNAVCLAVINVPKKSNTAFRARCPTRFGWSLASSTILYSFLSASAPLSFSIESSIQNIWRTYLEVWWNCIGVYECDKDECVFLQDRKIH